MTREPDWWTPNTDVQVVQQGINVLTLGSPRVSLVVHRDERNRCKVQWRLTHPDNTYDAGSRGFTADEVAAAFGLAHQSLSVAGLDLAKRLVCTVAQPNKFVRLGSRLNIPGTQNAVSIELTPRISGAVAHLLRRQ